MDSDEDVKPVPIGEYANNEYRYCPSKATCTVANRVNPFDTVGNYHERRLKEKLQKRNNGEIINIYKYNTTTPLSASTTSNNAQRTQEIKQELIEDVLSKQPHVRGEPMSAIYKRSDKSMSQAACNLATKRSDNPHATSGLRSTSKSSSYKHVRYNNYDQNNKNESFARNYFNKPVTNENRYPENSIHHNPLQNMCNEEFVLKTMQRHARLQKIVKKLVIERQKEKQKEAWNNYINELKNKHSYYSNEPTRIVPQYVPNEDEFIDDFWETRSTWEQPKIGQNLLNNVYGGHRNVQQSKYINMPCPHPRQYYERNPYCYPTASQGRLMMLNKEKERINSISRPLNKYKSIDIDRSLNRRRYTTIKCDRSFENIEMDKKKLNTLGVVTDEAVQESNNMDSFRKILKKQTPKMASLKEQILQTDHLKEVPLGSIEEKLDGLIKSVNSVIVEIREQKNSNVLKRPITKSRSISCTLRELSNLALSRAKSESYGFQKENDVLYTSVVQNSPTHLLLTEIGTSASHFKETNETEIEKIIEEEREKSEKIKKDIEELLHTQCNRQCSVAIEFDIPTREMSTVVGSSLPKTQYCAVKKVNKNCLIRSEDERNNRQMTIAVNTDPLGLCALLQVSADTIRQLLSYMLNLNYNSYLSVPMPGRTCIAHYMCNICGEAFKSPSQLSDHIENHYFGKKRGCCVCRHMLDLRKDRIGLFDCEYCGQRFTRAYCCDLHQQACAKRFGRRHDVESNLMLLR